MGLVPPPAPGMSKVGICGAGEGLGPGMRCCLGQRAGWERRGVRGAGPGAQQEQQYGAGNGSLARSGLSGRPSWALEAAGSACRAARPIPASISQLSDCIGLFLEDCRRGGGVLKGRTCLGKGGVATLSRTAAAPPASPCDLPLGALASLPLRAGTPCEPQDPAIRAGCGGCVQGATRASCDPCCRPLPQPSRTAARGPVHTRLLWRLVLPHLGRSRHRWVSRQD